MPAYDNEAIAAPLSDLLNTTLALDAAARPTAAALLAHRYFAVALRLLRDRVSASSTDASARARARQRRRRQSVGRATRVVVVG